MQQQTVITTLTISKIWGLVGFRITSAMDTTSKIAVATKIQPLTNRKFRVDWTSISQSNYRNRIGDLVYRRIKNR